MLIVRCPHVLQNKIKEVLKGEAVADLEKRMHKALDDAMVTIKTSVGSEITDPIKRDVEMLKEALKNQII